jgi:hypothetical protein
VFTGKRREPGDVFVTNRKALLPELSERGFHIEGVPQRDHVHDQSENAQLVFLPLSIALPQLSTFAVEDGAGDAMTSFTAIQLCERLPALGFIVYIIKGMQCLLDAAGLRYLRSVG